jgi:PAS domain-containing protein
LLLCREVATAYLASVARSKTELVAERRRRRPKWWPRGGEWKTQALGLLHRRLLARSGFVERALHSIEDGLLITSTTGRIAFANPRAAAIFMR